MNNIEQDKVLPESWIFCNLGDLIDPSKEKVHPKDIKKTRYIGLEHIEKDQGVINGYSYSDTVKSTKSVFKKGDLLYGKLRPYLNKVWIAEFDGICSTDILVYPIIKCLSSKYLYYRLLSSDFVRFSNNQVSGVQHPRVNVKKISGFIIELAPFPEQKRIVAKIEELFTKLDAGVDALKKAKILLKRYRQSVLKSAMEGKLTAKWREDNKDKIEPASELLKRILAERRAKWEKDQLAAFKAKGKKPKDDSWEKKYKEPEQPDTRDLPELPEGWVWTNIESISFVNPKTNVSKFNDRLKVSFVPMKAMETETGMVDVTQAKNLGQVRRGYTSFLNKDLLFAKITPCMENGKLAVVDNLKNGIGYGSTEFHVIRSMDSINPEFIFYFLVREHYRRDARQNMTGTAGQLRVPTDYIRFSIIPLPPESEQTEIILEIDKILSNIDYLNNQIDNYITLSNLMKKSILKKAFSGKLVNQDPKDGTAKGLLEKIRGK